MDFIEVNGTSLRYDIRGSQGPVVVLIHEMGGMLENWDLVIPELPSDYLVLRYDTRGAGLSEKVRGTLKVEDLADDLKALLEALGLDEPVAVVGCALGAATALCFAGRYPQLAAAVVAMSPAIDMKPEDRDSRRAMLDEVLREGMRAIVEGALASGYPQILRDPDPERFRAFKARWLGNDPESFVANYRMLIDMDIRGWLARITCPTLGICGTYDVFRPPEYVRRIFSGLPDVEFVTLETSHHQHVQTPKEVAAAASSFLQRKLGVGAQEKAQ
jgi:pimeloyl-ACP methyl ester carboxylesterase